MSAAVPKDDIAYAESGRGLWLVDALSATWGMAGDTDARWLWADVPWLSCGGPVLAVPSGDRDAEVELTELARAYPRTLAWYGEQTREWFALLPQPHDAGDTLCAPSPSALSRMLAARYLAVR